MISVHIAFLILIIHYSNVVHGHGKVRFYHVLSFNYVDAEQTVI